MEYEIKRCSCCKWEKIIVWSDYGVLPGAKGSKGKSSKGKYVGFNLCFDCLVQLKFSEVNELKKQFRKNIKECISCDKPFMLSPGKEWAIKCPNCWIKENNGAVSIEEAEFLMVAKEKRRKAKEFLGMQHQRLEWCEQLLLVQPEPPIKVLEMYLDENGEAVKGPLFVPQYFHEYRFCNTRTKLLSETRFECDKLPWMETLKLIYFVSEELAKKKITHYLFYSEGQRSPHIIIYDFYELAEMESRFRFKCQENFWKWIVPFHVQHADRSLWDDDHEFVPLEFANHWKTGEPFVLLQEVKP